jgi:hypothetical protein
MALIGLAGVYFSSPAKPMPCSLISREPRFDVMTRSMFRKSALRPTVVRQSGMVHDLEQDIADARVRLLDLVQEEDRIGVLADRLREEAALLEPDVAGRCAYQPRDGMSEVIGFLRRSELKG